MHVIHGLARPRAGIEDDAIPGIRDAFSDCHLLGVRDEASQQPIVGGCELG